MGAQKIIKFVCFLLLVFLATFSSLIDTQNRLRKAQTDTIIVSSDHKGVIVKSIQSSVMILSTSSFNDEGITSTSSGTYISHKGLNYIITSAHSLIGTCSTTVIIADDFIFDCQEFIYVDSHKDVALLQIEEIFNRNPITISNLLYGENVTKNNLGVHEKTFYTGYPQAMGPLTFDGKIVSHTTQNDTFLVNSYAWAGSSGSGVFNTKGNLIGIITAVSVANTEHGVDVMEDLIIVTPISLSDFREILQELKMPKEKPCINSLLDKIKGVDDKMNNLSEKLKIVKQMIANQPNDDEEYEEEECPDVVESEKALTDAIEKLYIEELLTRDPEGDA